MASLSRQIRRAHLKRDRQLRKASGTYSLDRSLHRLQSLGIGLGGALVLLGLPSAAMAGDGFTQTTDGKTTTYNQTADKVYNKVDAYNIAADELHRYIQPSSSSIFLQRVTGGDYSSILGQLVANGQVWIMNPSGVLIGSGAVVNTAGFLATSLVMDEDDFFAGRYNLKQVGDGGFVINEGSLVMNNGGYAVLAGASVVNNGYIEANMGQVVLASGRTMTVDFDGDGFLSFAVTDKTTAKITGPDGADMTSAVLNTGTIKADGGRVTMTAQAAASILDSVVNNEGVIEANSVEQKNGEIVLSGGDEGVVINSGQVKAAGDDAGEEGGVIKITGEYTVVTGSADASGQAGGGTVLVGGGYQGADATVQNAKGAFIGGDAEIKADATDAGDGGMVVVWSDENTMVYGNISAQGAGGGQGGLVETSGKILLTVNGAEIRAGEWLMDPTTVTIDQVASSDPTFAAGVFTPGAVATATVDVDDIQGALEAGTNVTINTTSAGGGTGDIIWGTSMSADMSAAGGTPTLTLNAWRNFTTDTLLDSIQATNGTGFNLVINANVGGGGGNVTINSQIDLQPGGNFTSTGVDFTTQNLGLILTSSGSTININHTGTVSIGQQIVTAGGSVAFNDTISAINLGADINAAAGTISFGNNPVTLTNGVVLTTNGAGGVTFGSTVDGAFALTVFGGTGDVTFSGAIGTTTPLASLTVDSADDVTLANIGGASSGVSGNTSITAADDLYFTGTVYSANQQTYAAGPATFQIASGGANFVSSNDLISFSGGDIELAAGANLVINAGTGTVTTEGIDGAAATPADVTITGGAVTVGQIGDDSGGATGINDVAINATSIVTTGSITTTDAGAVNLNSSGLIQLGGNIDTTDSGTANAGTITLANVTQLNTSVVLRTDGTTDANVTIANTINASTAGVEGLTILAGGADVILNAVVGGIVRLGALSIVGNDITFNQNVEATGITVAAADPGADPESIVVAAGVTLDANGGDLSFASDTITLGAGSSLASTGAAGADAIFMGETAARAIGLAGGAGDLQLSQADLDLVAADFRDIVIGFDDTQTGTVTVNALTLNNTGLHIRTEAGSADVFINGAVALTANGDDLNIDGSGSTTTLSANITTDGGRIVIDDAVVVDGGITLDTTEGGGTAGGANVFITGDIDGNAGADTLTVNGGTGGTVTLAVDGVTANDIGVNATLNDLTFSGAAGISIGNIGTVGASGLEAASGALSFPAPTNLAGTAYHTIDGFVFTDTVTLYNAGITQIIVDTNNGAVFQGAVSGNGGTEDLRVNTSNNNTIVDFQAGANVSNLLNFVVNAGTGQVNLRNVTAIDGDIIITGSNSAFGGNDIHLLGTTITSTGTGVTDTIEFHGDVLLGANVVITGAGGAGDSISFDSVVEGAQTLTVYGGAGGGNVLFSDDVGGNTALTGFDVDSGVQITLQAVTTNNGIIQVGNNAGDRPATLILNDDLTSHTAGAAGAIGLHADDIILEAAGGAAGSITVSSNGTADNTITITTDADTLRSNTAWEDGLVLDAGTSTVDISGATLANLDHLVITAASLTLGAVTVGANDAGAADALGITTTVGDLTLTGDLSTIGEANAGTITLTSAGNIVLSNAGGTITITTDSPGGTDEDVSLGTVVDAAGANTALTIQSGGGDVTFASTVGVAANGPIGALTVVGDEIDFQGNVEATGIDVTGATQINVAAVTMDANAGNLTFSSDDIVIAGGASLISTGGGTNATLRGTTGATSIELGTGASGNTLSLTEAELQTVGTTFINLVIGWSGSQSGAVEVDNSVGDGTLNLSNTNLVVYADTAGADFTVTSPIVMAGAGHGVTVNGSYATTNLNADITTASGVVTINDNVLVDGSRTIDTTNGGAAAAAAITINGTVAGANAAGADDLTLDATAGGGNAAVTITGNVDGANDLGGLTITGAQVDVANIVLDGTTLGIGMLITGSNIDLNGTTYTIANGSGNDPITFTGPVDLNANVNVSGGGTAGDDITFSSTVNSESGNTYGLNVQSAAADVFFNGVIGGVDALTSLAVNNAAGAGNITLSGIGLGALPAGEGVDGSTTVGNAATASITFGGGNYNANQQTYTATAGQNLDMTGSSKTFTSSDDNISFNTATISLGNNTNLTVNSNGGAISAQAGIRGTSDETVTLNADTGSTNTVDVGAIGSGDEILSIIISGSGGVTLRGDLTTSSTNAANNDIVVNGTATIMQDTTIKTGGAGAGGALTAIDLDNVTAPDGSVFDLTINAGAGTVTVGQIGDNTTDDNIANVTITGTAGVTLNGSIYTGDDAGDDGTVQITGGGANGIALGTNITIDTVDGGADGAVTLNSPANGAFSLTINAGADNVALDSVGNVTPVTSLDVTGATITLNGATITTAGGAGNDVDLTGAVVLGTTVTITANAGNITIDGAGTVDATGAGVEGLNLVSTSGDMLIAGDMGGGTRLGAVDVNSTSGTLTWNGDILTDDAKVDFSGVTGGTLDLTGNDGSDFIVDTDVSGGVAGEIRLVNGAAVSASGIDISLSATSVGTDSDVYINGVSGGTLMAKSVVATGDTIFANNVTSGVGAQGNISLTGSNAGTAIELTGTLIDTTNGGATNAGTLTLTATGGGILNLNPSGGAGTTVTLRTDGPGANDTTITIGLAVEDAVDNVNLTLNAGTAGDVDINDTIGAADTIGLLIINGDQVTIGGAITSQGLKVTSQTSTDIDAAVAVDFGAVESWIQSPAIDNSGGGTITGTAVLTYRPLTAGTAFNVGDGVAGVTNAALTAIQASVTRLEIGWDDTQADAGGNNQTGAITINSGGNVNIAVPVVVQADGATVNLANNITLTQAGDSFTLNGANATTNVTANSTIQTNNGVIDINDHVSIAGGVTLTLDSDSTDPGVGAAISISGLITGTLVNANLTIDAGDGTVTLGTDTNDYVGFSGGARLGDVNIVSDGDVTIWGSVYAQTVVIGPDNAAGSNVVTFNETINLDDGGAGDVLDVTAATINFSAASDITTANSGNVDLNGTGAGTVTMPNTAAAQHTIDGNFDIDGNFTSVSLGENIQTNQGTINIGSPLTLTENVFLDTEPGAGVGAAITLASVDAEGAATGETLTFDSGTGGDITVAQDTGAVNPLGLITITNADDVNFNLTLTAAGIVTTNPVDSFRVGGYALTTGAAGITVLTDGDDGTGAGIRFSSGANASGYDIFLEAANDVIFGGSWVQSAGADLTIQGATTATQLFIGSDAAGGGLDMSDGSLSLIHDNFANVIFGQTGQTGDMVFDTTGAAILTFGSNLSFWLDGGADLTLNNNLSTTANQNRNITIIGAAGSNWNLAADVFTDGGNVTTSGGGHLIVDNGATRTIDTENGADNNAGYVDLQSLTTTSSAAGGYLVIDTSSLNNVGGAIALGAVNNDTAYLRVLDLYTYGPTTGTVYVTQDITLAESGTSSMFRLNDGAANVNGYYGNMVVGTTIDLSSATNGIAGGLFDVGDTSIIPAAAGSTITINTSFDGGDFANAANNGGNVIFGSITNNGANYFDTVNIDMSTTDSLGTPGTLDFSDVDVRADVVIEVDGVAGTQDTATVTIDGLLALPSNSLVIDTNASQGAINSGAIDIRNVITDGAAHLTLTTSGDGNSVNAGNVRIGDMGTTTPLASLTVDTRGTGADGTLFIHDSDSSGTAEVYTDGGGGIDFSNASIVILMANTLLDTDSAGGGTDAGEVDFNSGGMLDGAFSLTVDSTSDTGADADVDIDSTVGGTVDLTNVQVTAADITITGAVNTTGAQTYTSTDEAGFGIIIGADLLADTDNGGTEDITITSALAILQDSGSIYTMTGGVQITANSDDVGADGVVVLRYVRSDGANQIGAQGALPGGNVAISIEGDSVTMTDIDGDNILATAGDVEVYTKSGNILLGDVNAAGFTVFLEAADSTIDNNVADRNVEATTLTAWAANLIGQVSDDQVYLDPEDATYTGDALETSIVNLNATTTALDSDIAIDNTDTGGGLTILTLNAGGANAASAWVRNSASLDISGITASITGSDDRLGFIATTGNLVIVAPVAGNSTYTMAGSGTQAAGPTLKLEAPAGDVIGTGGAATDTLTITTSNFVLKSATTEKLITTVERIDAAVTGLNNDLLINETDALDVLDLDTNPTALTATDVIELITNGDTTINDTVETTLAGNGVLAGTAFSGMAIAAGAIEITVQDPGAGNDLVTANLTAADVADTEILAASSITITVEDGYVSLAQVADNALEMTAHNGNVIITISAPDAPRSVIFGDGSLVKGVSVAAIGGNLIVDNDDDPDNGAFDATINANAGDINIDTDAGLTAYTLVTDPITGLLNIQGDVNIAGEVISRQGRTITFEAVAADIIITPTGLTGSGTLTLNPGAAFSVIVQDGGFIEVNEDTIGNDPGNLIVINALNFEMQGDNSYIRVDGGVDIGAGVLPGGVAGSVTGDITLNNVLIDANGNGDYPTGNPTGFYARTTLGDIYLNGNLDANSTPGYGNDVTLQADSGDILDSADNGSQKISNADVLTLIADPIGEDSDPIEVDALFIYGDTSGAPNGGIYIFNQPSGDVQVQFVTDGGDVFYSQQGMDLTIDDWSVVGDAIHTAGGSAIIDAPVNVDINADINSGGGAIVVEASNNINVNAGNVISGGGDVQMTADQDADSAGDLTFTQDGAAAGTEKLQAGAGNVDLSGENIILRDFSVATTGTATLTAGKDPGSSGQIDGDVDPDGNVDITAATLNLVANGAGIGTTHPVEFNASAAVNATADGDIFLTNQAGAFNIGAISASGGVDNVTLVSQGNVVDAFGDVGVDVTADVLTITAAAGSIGSGAVSADTDIDIDVTSLVAANVGGGINVEEHDAATNDGIDLTNVSTAAGADRDIFVLAAGDVTATSVAANGAGSDVYIYAASGNISADDVSASDGDIFMYALADIRIDSIMANDDTVTLMALSDIVDQGNADDEISAGTVSMTAGETIIIDDGIVDAATISANTIAGAGDITLSHVDATGGTNLLNVFAANGAINITSTGGALTLTMIENNGTGDANDINIDSTGQQMTVVTMIALGQGDVHLTGGSLVDDGVETTRINGDDLQMDITGDIGAGAVNMAIDTNVNTINVPDNADDADNVYITERNNVTLTAIYAENVVSVIAGGPILATLVVTGGAAGDDVTLTSINGAVTVDMVNAGAGGDVTVSGTSVLNSAAGDGVADIIGDLISLTATDGSIGTAANEIEIDSGTSVTADSSTAGGLINIEEITGDMNVASINAGTGSVTLLATAAGAGQQIVALNSVDSIADVSGGLLTADADGAITLETDVDAVDLQTNDLNAAVAIYDVDAAAAALAIVDITTDNGAVTVTNAGVSSLLVGSINTDNGGNGGATIFLMAGGEITDLGEDTTVDLIGTDATLFALSGGIGAGNALETNLDSIVFAAAGAVKFDELNAGGALSVQGTATGSDISVTTANGTLTVTAGGLDATAGDITLTAGGTDSDVLVNGALRTDSGRITVTADRNITLTAIIDADDDNAGFTGDVNLFATNGAITGNDNLITARRLDARANGNIFIDTETGSIVAISAVGSVNIDETDDLTVGYISAANTGQTVVIDAGGYVSSAMIDGNPDVVADTSLTIDAQGDVTLETDTPVLDVDTTVNHGSIILISMHGAPVTFTGSTDDGDLQVYTDDDLTITAGGAASGDSGGHGNVTLQAGGSLTTDGIVRAYDGQVDMSADDFLDVNAVVQASDGITLSADGASGGAGNEALRLGANVITANGWVVISASAADGDIIQDNAAAQIQQNGTNGTVQLIANTVTLNGLGITSAADDMIAIKITSSGNNSAVVTGANAVLTATGDEGSIVIDPPWNVTIGADVTATGDVTIIAVDDIDLNANVTADSDQDGMGSVVLTANSDTGTTGDLTVGATYVVSGENITVTAVNVDGGIFHADYDADADGEGDGDLIISVTGTAGLNNAIAEATGVNVLINAGDDVNVTTTTADNDVSITGDSVTVSAVTANDGDVTITAAGAIQVNGAVGAFGSDITLIAGTTITTGAAGTLTADDDITLVAGSNISLGANVTADNDTSGAGDLTVETDGDVSALNAAGITLTGEDVSINAKGDVTVGQVAAYIAGNIIADRNGNLNGDIAINSAGAGGILITGTVQAADIDISGAADITLGVINAAVATDVVQSTINHVSIDASANLNIYANVIAAQNLFALTTTGPVTISQDDATEDMLAGGNVVIGSALNNVVIDGTVGGSAAIGLGVGITAGGSVDVNATLDGLVTGKVRANMNVDVTAGTNITVDDPGVLITADDNSDGVGDLTLYAGGYVDSDSAGTSTNLSGENVTITALTSYGIFDQIRSNRNGDTVGDTSITTAGGTTLNGTVQAGVASAPADDNTGDVTIVSGDIIVINGAISNAEDVTLTAVTNVANNAGITSDDNITITAGLDILTSVAIDAADADADDIGSVTMTAGGRIDLSDTSSSVSADQNVTMIAGSGDADAIDLNDDVLADNGDVSIEATNGSVLSAATAPIEATLGGVLIAADDDITLNGSVSAGGAGAAYADHDVIKITTINTVAGDDVVTNGTLTTTGVDADINIDPYDVTVNAAVASTGNVEITAMNTIDINAIVTAYDDIVLFAGLNILISADMDAADTDADNIGSVTMTAGGRIDLEDTTSSVSADQNVTMTAGSTAADAIDLNDSVLADNGDVSIEATNGSVLSAATAPITATLGGVLIAADDDITLNGNVEAGGAGAAYADHNVIKITTINTVAGDDLVTNGTLTTTGTDADINIDPYDATINAAVTATGNVEIETMRNATFGAGGDILAHGSWIQIFADTGYILMANGTVFTADGGGAILLEAAENITLGQLVTNNNTPWAVQVISLNAGILDGNGDTNNISATQANAVVTLQADDGIGNSNALETDIVNLSAQNDVGGAIWITEANALNILRAFNMTTGSITITALGNVVVTADGSGVYTGGASPVTIYAGDNTHAATLTVNQEVISNGGVVSLFGEDDAIFSSTGDVYSNGGDVFVWADYDGDANGSGGALTMSNGTVFDAGAGHADLRADERVTLGEVRSTNADDNAVQITTSADVIDGNGNDLNVFASGGGLVVVADNGIGEIDDALETEVRELDLRNALTGVINILEMDDVTIDFALQQPAAAQDPDRHIIIVTLDGSMTVNDQGAGTAAVSTVEDGYIVLDANGATSSIVVSGLVVNEDGDISITADDNATFNVHGDVISDNGNLLLKADADEGEGGADGYLSMVDNGVDTATAMTGTGTITVSADEDVVVGRLATGNTTLSAVSVTSTSGAIVDGGDTDTWDIEALGVGAGITLVAELGIGDGNALEIQGTQISADTHLNDVEIFNDSDGADVYVTSLTTEDGDIFFTQDGDGDIFFEWVNAHGHSAGNFGEVHLENLGDNADIYLGDVFSSSTAVVYADGSIFNDGSWVNHTIVPAPIAGTDLSAEDIFLTAVHGTIGVWHTPVEVQVDGEGALRVYAGGKEDGWLSVNLQGLEPYSLLPDPAIPGMVLYNVAEPGRLIRDGGSAALFDSTMTRRYFQATAQDTAWLAADPGPYAPLFLDIYGDAVFVPYEGLYTVDGVKSNKDE